MIPSRAVKHSCTSAVLSIPKSRLPSSTAACNSSREEKRLIPAPLPPIFGFTISGYPTASAAAMAFDSQFPLIVAPSQNLVNSSAQEQIRPVSARLFQCSLAPPFRHFRMISADQHFRHAPPAKLGGPRVVRIVEQDFVACSCWLVRCEILVTSSGRNILHLSREGATRTKRFVLRRGLIPQRVRQQSCHCIDHQHRRQFPATQYKIAHGNFLGSQVLRDPLVHALISAANKND